jgi:hypothetical protein
MSSVSPFTLATSAYSPVSPATRPVPPSANHFGKMNSHKDGDRFERSQPDISMSDLLEAQTRKMEAVQKASRTNLKPVIFANANTPLEDFAANPVTTGGLVALFASTSMAALGSLRSRQGALLTAAVGAISGLWAGTATQQQNKEIFSLIA